jgi:hypothetical protein
MTGAEMKTQMAEAADSARTTGAETTGETEAKKAIAVRIRRKAGKTANAGVAGTGVTTAAVRNAKKDTNK